MACRRRAMESFSRCASGVSNGSGVGMPATRVCMFATRGKWKYRDASHQYRRGRPVVQPFSKQINIGRCFLIRRFEIDRERGVDREGALPNADEPAALRGRFTDAVTDGQRRRAGLALQIEFLGERVGKREIE